MEPTRLSGYYSSINIFKYLMESVKNAVNQQVSRILDYIAHY